MTALPTDVLIEVFRRIQPPELYRHRYGLIDAASVNKSWRAAALASSSLWSRIRTKDRRDRSLFPLLLERSGSAPLDVHLDMFCNDYGNASDDTTPAERAEIVQALIPHVGRIQKLYIRHQTLEADDEDLEAIQQLVDAGLEFPVLMEYTHECIGDDESDLVLDLTAPNLLKASLDGVGPRELSPFLVPSLVELQIGGMLVDINVLDTIFQRCVSLESLTLRPAFEEDNTGPVFSNTGHTPPPSLQTLDLQMSMPELVALLALFSPGPPLPFITICDDQGLTASQLARTKKPHPILTAMLRGLSPIIAFEVYSDQDVLLRDAAGRVRRFQVAAEDSESYDPPAFWAFLVARHAAHRSVRTFLGTTSAWGQLAAALGRQQPEVDEGVELQLILDDHGSFNADVVAPLRIDVLAKVTLQPTIHLGRKECGADALLRVLSMVRTKRGIVTGSTGSQHAPVVCLGELVLAGVAPREYGAAYEALAEGLKAGGWAPCACCVERAKEIQGRGERRDFERVASGYCQDTTGLIQGWVLRRDVLGGLSGTVKFAKNTRTLIMSCDVYPAASFACVSSLIAMAADLLRIQYRSFAHA
ncbi:hypothetical protein C8R43DRAFT_1101168 [Mycena crocata]|nr:hypothetical protein C8R43DRAFT_1101168 [Mycena crocata]